MTTPEDTEPGKIIPFRRPRPTQPQRPKCPACGTEWAPGFSSDPAWLLTADPGLDSYTGVTHCRGCGQRKLDVLLGRDTRQD
ncbi:hypothetical protein [Streptomyces sp. PT19]|uniref:hypothetical protein n=1 Tax=Streptomyces sp. PT19 TaxID=3452239 RepID=UPI003F81F244